MKYIGNVYTVMIVIILIAIILYKFINIPASIFHISNMVFTPNDLYKPIVLDDFLFLKKDFSKTYYLKPKYYDIYEIGITSSKEDIPANYKFKGKLKFSFYSKDKLLLENYSLSNPSVFYSKNDNTKLRSIVLTTFDFPLINKYKNDISVKVIVIEEDETLKNYFDSIKLYFAVSSTP